MKQEMECELHRLLHYWSNDVVDHEHGGFLGRIDHFGNRDATADKSAVLNARLLWSFSAGYRLTQDAQYLEAANRAYEYLMNQFWDVDFGGFYWSVDYKGEPNNTRKQAYAQGFGVYALSEYYRATHNQEALHQAIELYQIIENKFADPTFGGYIEALSQDWTALEDMRLSNKDANEPKSMNTHLHILEPYTNLYRVWKDNDLKQDIENLLQVFSDRILDHSTGHYHLFFENNWTVKSSTISYGHDIEGAWLMNEAAIEIGSQDLIKKFNDIAIQISDVTIHEGLDTDGSIFNEMHGTTLDDDKHWWPQAEAMVGFMDAYQINNDSKYLTLVHTIWQYIKEYVIDTSGGEWYGRLTKDGTPVEEDDKIGFWKCPYHNSRALIEVYSRITELLSNEG